MQLPTTAPAQELDPLPRELWTPPTQVRKKAPAVSHLSLLLTILLLPPSITHPWVTIFSVPSCYWLARLGVRAAPASNPYQLLSDKKKGGDGAESF